MLSSFLAYSLKHPVGCCCYCSQAVTKLNPGCSCHFFLLKRRWLVQEYRTKNKFRREVFKLVVLEYRLVSCQSNSEIFQKCSINWNNTFLFYFFNQTPDNSKQNALFTRDFRRRRNAQPSMKQPSFVISTKDPLIEWHRLWWWIGARTKKEIILFLKVLRRNSLKEKGQGRERLANELHKKRGNKGAIK